jgi:peptidoglycan hydrolase-like protein with peptidoglycan-binding domain
VKSDLAVKELQTILVKYGYMTQEQVQTGPGILGPKTRNAVARLLEEKGKVVSGGTSGSTSGSTGGTIFPAPSGFEAIKATFGKAGENMVTIQLPLGASGKLVNVTLHQKMVPVMKACLEDAQKKDLLKHIRTFDGMYPGFVRNKRNGKTGRELQPPQPSVHSWGIAFDINANPAPGKVHADLVKHFKDWGFTWGGDFKSNVDPMHFQYASGY